jgi:hypothetical protein
MSKRKKEMNTGSAYDSGCSTERINKLSRWKRASEMQGHAACEMSGNFDYLRCENLESGRRLLARIFGVVTEFSGSARVGVSDSEEGGLQTHW